MCGADILKMQIYDTLTKVYYVYRYVVLKDERLFCVLYRLSCQSKILQNKAAYLSKS